MEELWDGLLTKFLICMCFFKTEELLTRDFGDMIEDNMKAAEIAYAIRKF